MVVFGQINKLLILGVAIAAGQSLLAADGSGSAQAFQRKIAPVVVVDEKTPANGWQNHLPMLMYISSMDRVAPKPGVPHAARALPKPATQATSEEVVGCEFCHKGFEGQFRFRNLKEHRFLHYQRHLFKCLHEGCAYQGKTCSSVSQHARAHHSGVEPRYGCTLCVGISFKSPAEIVKHVLEQHDKLETAELPKINHAGGAPVTSVLNRGTKRPAPVVQYDDSDAEIDISN